jgi:hypothetical protein
MNIKLRFAKKYKGQGLVEAVLAIAIAGIACLIFLDIASHSIIVVDDISKTDQLTKVSTDTAQKVRKIAELQNNTTNTTTKLFPDPNIYSGSCFEIIGDVQQPLFKNITGPACSLSNISGCRTGVLTVDNVFSVYCITSVTNNLVIGKVYSGLKTCQTLKGSNACRVADSEYNVGVYIDASVRAVCNFNAVCESSRGETIVNCLDCSANQGFGCTPNGICELTESTSSCPSDCKVAQTIATCGNNLCDPSFGETVANCPGDCKCGNGVCNTGLGENAMNCVADCHCGNGTCDSAYSETTLTCNADCSIQ